MRLTYEVSGVTEKTQQQSILPSASIHERLGSIEGLLLKTIIGVLIGVFAILLLVGWIVLQMHRFGNIPMNTRSETENSKTTQQAAVIIAGQVLG